MMPLLAAAASMAGNLTNFVSQERTNKSNSDNAMYNRDFQREMSNTAHQREVEDLKLAGLNPTLSAGGGGASTPSGSTPSLSAPTIQLPDLFAYGVSLKQLSQVDRQLDQKDQQLGLSTSDLDRKIKDSGTGRELTRAKTKLAQKGMIRANLEGEASDFLSDILKKVKSSVRTPALPRQDLDPDTKKSINSLMGL